MRHGSFPLALSELEPIPETSPNYFYYDTPDGREFNLSLTTDPWGAAIMYRSNGKHYLLWSRGSDRRTDQDWKLTKFTEGWTSDSIVFDNGALQWYGGSAPPTCDAPEIGYQNARELVLRGFLRPDV